MESNTAIDRLSALAQENRLAVFRLLIAAGEDGLAAGEIARRLDVQPNTLSAQLNILAHAGLVTRTRQGRSIVYTAQFDAMGELLIHLIEGCCEGNVAMCGRIADAAARMSKCA